MTSPTALNYTLPSSFTPSEPRSRSEEHRALLTAPPPRQPANAVSSAFSIGDIPPLDLPIGQRAAQPASSWESVRWGPFALSLDWELTEAGFQTRTARTFLGFSTSKIAFD